MNRNRSIKAADKYLRQGKTESAIRELLKLVAANPRDVTTINRIGDLYSKVGKKEEAIQQFSKIARYYTDEGFLLKAIAIYKKITKLQPTSLEAYRCLAELYSRQGLTMEARAQYQFVADQCLKEDRRDDALEVLREMERLHPNDLKVRLSLAELLGRMERRDEALEVYRDIGVRLDRKGMHRESCRVYEAALTLAPGEVTLVRRLVAALLALDESGRAFEVVNGLLEERPEDPELLSLLGDAHLRTDDVERAREIYQQVRDRAPDRIENRMNDSRLCLHEGDVDGCFFQLEEARREAQGPEICGRLLPYVQDLLDAQPHHLGGLEALARLHEAVGDEPACRDAYIRLSGSSMEQGELQTASSALRHLLRLDPENPRHGERLDEVLRRLREQGEEVPVEDRETVETDESLDAAAEGPGVGSFGDLDAMPESTEPLDQDFIAEHMTEAEVFIKYGLTDKALDQLRIVVERYPQLLAAHEALLSIYKEEGDRQAAVEECRWIARILQEEGDPDGAARALEEAARILPGALEAAAESAEAAPAAGVGAAAEGQGDARVVSGADPGELEEVDLEEAELEEEELEIEVEPQPRVPSAAELGAVDALLTEGKMDEARRQLLELRGTFPGCAEIEARLDRAQMVESQAAGAQAAGHESDGGDGDYVDLASELDPSLFQSRLAVDKGRDLAEGHAMDNLVAAFKQGVEDQVDDEDFETHYNLAIAYKEMGLLDEAIGEFQFAAKSTEFFTKCCSMLGICFREKGMNDLAIKWYGRGLESAMADGEEESLGLRYDLAALYQDSGDHRRALDLFTEVYGVDAGYRDVPDRIRALKQVLG